MSHESPASPNGTTRHRSALGRLCAAAAPLLVLLFVSPAGAQQAIPIDPDAWADAPVFSVESPIGPLEYRAGRGFRVGDTGLVVGGFTTVEADDEEHGDATVELDSISFLVLWQPLDALRFFSEVEVGGLALWDADGDDFDHDPEATIERLYAEWGRSDAWSLRIGKFQTPIGRWNLVPAEPFVWTAVDPVFTDVAFDEHQTGAALFGTVYPGRTTLRYWLYGQMVDPLDADDDPPNARRAAGARLEWSGGLGQWSVGSSLYASKLKGEWQYLAGLDGTLQLGPVELTSEAVFSEGGIEGRDLWAIYLQGVGSLGRLHRRLDGLYLVARFEHFDPDGHHDDSSLWDLGFTWLPAPWLNVKIGYRLTDRVTDDVGEGVSTSLSVLF